MCLAERKTRQPRTAVPRALRERGARALRGAANCLLCALMARLLLLLAFLAEDVLAARTSRPCPCRARAGGRRGSRRRPGRPAACRCRRPTISVLGAGDLDVDAGRDRVVDVVAVAELQLQLLALHRGAIADAADLERLRVALGDAVDHVGDQVRDMPHMARAGLVRRAASPSMPPSSFSTVDLVGHGQRQLALRPFTLTVWPVDRRRHAGRDGHRLLADTRHRHLPSICRDARAPSEHPAEHFAADVLLARARCPTSRPWASTGSRCRARCRRSAGRATEE